MKKKILFSIIIPVFNSEKTIKKTLISIKNQSFNKFEIIVIDKLSSDNTISIINSFKFSYIKIFSSNDKGIYDAINKGILRSRGSIISILHSDDFYKDKTILAKVYKKFITNKVPIVYGDLFYLSRHKEKKVLRYWKSNKFRPGSFLYGWSPPHPTFFVKKKIYLRYGLYKIRYGNSSDIELMHRFLETYKISSFYFNKVLICMRYGGVSNSNLSNIIIQNYQVIKFLKINFKPIKIITFLFLKILNRFMQFILGRSRKIN